MVDLLIGPRQQETPYSSSVLRLYVLPTVHTHAALRVLCMTETIWTVLVTEPS